MVAHTYNFNTEETKGRRITTKSRPSQNMLWDFISKKKKSKSQIPQWHPYTYLFCREHVSKPPADNININIIGSFFLLCIHACSKVSFKDLAQCGSLNENGPQRLLYLNTWYPVRGTIWEGWGGMSFLDKGNYWRCALRFQKMEPLPLCSLPPLGHQVSSQQL